MKKVSKASRGSADPFRRKVERQDSAAGSLRGADDSVCIDHRLRISHQNNTHIDQNIDEHIDQHGDQRIDGYQYDNPDDHAYLTFDLTKTLTDAYHSHIAAIKSGNMTALAGQYEANATLYAPQNGNLGNLFDGAANITSFYEGELSDQCPPCFGVDFPFAGVANETYSITTSKDHNEGNVTSQLILYGIGGPYGQSTFTNGERFGISYVLQGDRWLISTESLTQISGGYCQFVSLTNDGVLICTTLSG